MKRGVVLGLALAVALGALGRLVWSRWRAYGDAAEMRRQVYWA